MHISITGRLGSGKSTVAKLLAKDWGFELYSTGTIIRGIADSLGVTALEMNKLMSADPKYDLMIDEASTRISRERASDNILFDSRMAWHFALQTFKVYLYVDTEVAAARVLRDQTRGAVETYRDLDDAVTQLNARMNEENLRYKKLYQVDNFDFSNYDIIIDTAHRDPETIARMIMDAYADWRMAPWAYVGPRKYM